LINHFFESTYCSGVEHNKPTAYESNLIWNIGIGIFFYIVSNPFLIEEQLRFIIEITTMIPTTNNINKNIAPYNMKLVIDLTISPAVVIAVVTILVTSVPTTVFVWASSMDYSCLA